MSLRLLCAFLALTAPALHAAAPFTSPDASCIRTLLRQLDDDDFHVRQQADAALRRLGKVALPALQAELGRSRSLEVRWRLRRIVHDLTLDERVGALVRQLADDDAPTREQADWSLRQAGAAVVPLLRQQLKPELSAEHRRRVEQIIAELAPRGAEAALLRA